MSKRTKRTKRHLWTARQVDLLRQLYPSTASATIAERMGIATSQVYHKAHTLGLKKSAEFYATRDAGRLNGVRGQQTRFKPGHQTWNKGMKGIDIGGKDTRFKPGSRPHTWRPIGTERVSADGYLERKLTDTGCTRRDYVPVHRIVWRAAGPGIQGWKQAQFRPRQPGAGDAPGTHAPKQLPQQLPEGSRRNHPAARRSESQDQPTTEKGNGNQ